MSAEVNVDMETMIEKLGKVTDTRRQRGNLRHKLVDILFIGLVSVICGGRDFEHMEDTGNGKYDWLKRYLELPHGIPDSDTFRRVFERVERSWTSRAGPWRSMGRPYVGVGMKHTALTTW